jgi:hypothetical protein
MSGESPIPTLYVCHGDEVLAHSRAILAWVDRQPAG